MKKLIISVVFFYFVSNIYAQNDQITGRERFFSRPPSSRSIWVWNTIDLLRSKSARNKFFKILSNPYDNAKPINNIYFNCASNYLINKKLKKKMVSFIQTAHKKGICVQFLAGHPAWAYQNREVITMFKTISEFNKTVPPNAHLDGVHLDIEPHTLPMWSTKPKLRTKFFESIKIYGEKMRQLNPDLLFGLDIPIFWNEKEIKLFFDSLDYVTLMNYTDNANSIYKRAKKFLEVADKIGKKVESGIETQGPSKRWGVTLPITFYDEGWEIMEKTLSKANKKLSKHKSFIGIAIHYYTSYKKLQKERIFPKDQNTYPTQPIIDIPHIRTDIKIDGNLDDWKGIKPIPIDERKYVVYQVAPKKWEGLKDLSCDAYLAWSQQGLYLAFDVKDDIIVQNGTNDMIVNGDHIEIWFDTDYETDEAQPFTNEDDFQIGLSPGNFKDVKPDLYVWAPARIEQKDTATIKYTAKKTDHGYIIESYFPSTFFGDFKPEPNKKIRFNLDPSDTDGPVAIQEVLMSTSICRKYNNPRSFRLGIFKEKSNP